VSIHGIEPLIVYVAAVYLVVKWESLVRILHCQLSVQFVSLLVWFILSCMVLRPKVVKPSGIPFSVVLWIGVGFIKKSSRNGVTQHDAPDSMITCVVSCVEPFIVIKTAILNSVLLCQIILV
jgi:hypothetical protein